MIKIYFIVVESVVVMDNTPYHNTSVETLPTSAWKKVDIMNCIKSQNIKYTETMVKPQKLCREKGQHIKYVVDEMTKA